MDGLPVDAEVGATWTVMKRDAMARVVRDSTEPYFRVTSVPMEGMPIHVHPLGVDDHEEDHFSRGIDAFGPLGYTLLRSQVLVLPHLHARVAELAASYDRLVGDMVAARADGVPDWLANYERETRLHVWDALGLLLPLSDELANMFVAVNQHEGEGIDLGRALLRGDAHPHRVFPTASFNNVSWWQRHLGLRGSYGGVVGLTSRQKEVLRLLAADSLELVRLGLRDLSRIWTPELHRVATRYKHGFTLMSASHAVVWGSEAGADVYGRGGLLVADTDVDGTPYQLSVDITIGNVEVLFGCMWHAVGLLSALNAGLLGRVEHTTGRAIAIHPMAEVDATTEEVLDAVGAYAGIPANEWRSGMENELGKQRTAEAIRIAGRQLRGEPVD